jgi:hypothetical protein
VRNDEIDEKYHWHPHAGNGDRNNLYLPADKLYPDMEMPGAGLLTYAPKCVLTKYGMSVSRWNLPDFMRGLDFQVDTKHESLLCNFHDAVDGQNYFQFVGYGQEFVLAAHPGAYETFYAKSLEEWAYRMLMDVAVDKTFVRLRKEKLSKDFGSMETVTSVINGALVFDELGQCRETYLHELTYCRYYHRIIDFNTERCAACPLYRGSAQGRGADCLYDIPISNGKPLEIPQNPIDRYAFYELLIQKGILHRKDISWDACLDR